MSYHIPRREELLPLWGEPKIIRKCLILFFYRLQKQYMTTRSTKEGETAI